MRPGPDTMGKSRNQATRQRGVALVTALLVVSLATVAAVAMATRFQIDLRRTGNLLNGEQVQSTDSNSQMLRINERGRSLSATLRYKW